MNDVKYATQSIRQAFTQSSANLLYGGIQKNPEAFDTIGGLVAHELGHVPRRGEYWDMSGLRFEVLHAKGGAVHWFRVTRQSESDR